MVYFTSDLHFYHEKIIHATDRPFGNADEMDRALIRNWNDRVGADDDIYILGDLTMKGPELAMAVLSSLKGRKHLVRGNHDGFAARSTFEQSLFVSIQDYAELSYSNTLFILCHYPMVEWNGSRRGSIMLHGHQHNHADYNLENRRRKLLRYDVGVDANDMSPVSAAQILAFFGDPDGTKRRGQDDGTVDAL